MPKMIISLNSLFRLRNDVCRCYCRSGRCCVSITGFERYTYIHTCVVCMYKKTYLVRCSNGKRLFIFFCHICFSHLIAPVSLPIKKDKVEVYSSCFNPFIMVFYVDYVSTRILNN